MTFNRLILQFNPYHLVAQSPWPILVSFSLLSFTQSAVMYMHGYANGGILLTLGFAATTLGMILWFRDIIKEATFEGAHTTQVQNGLIIGFVLFIVSEAFAFLSIFWAFFHSALSPAIEIGGVWPEPLNLLYLICFILICLLSWSYFKIFIAQKSSYNKISSQGVLQAEVQSIKIDKRMSSYRNINLNKVMLEFEQIKKEFNPEQNSFNQEDFHNL